MRIGVIGAGLGGLAAACELVDGANHVTVLERRPWAGGKTYSFADRDTGGSIDNGQHVFMTCTRAYIDFLRKLGTLGLTSRQQRLRVPVFDAGGRRSDLWSAPLPAPLHLMQSFAAYRHLSPAEKARIGRAMAAIMRMSPQQREEQSGDSFEAWLRRHGQQEGEIQRFWDLIVLPTLNCGSQRASAAQALFVFQEGFLKSSRSGAIGLPAAGLSELHVLPAIRYIERRGGEVRTRAHVERLNVEGGRIAGLTLATGERLRFDAYVAALPPRGLAAMLPPDAAREAPFDQLARFETASIVNLHLWYAEPVAPFDFAAFTGPVLQWIFNRSRIAASQGAHNQAPGPEHLVISLSDASPYLDRSKERLLRDFLPQLQRLLPRTRASRLLRFVAIKEPEATFVPAPGLRRPGPVTPIRNLFLAGAHVATGWPATMESAVRSGIAAASALTERAPLLERLSLVGSGGQI